MISKHPAAWAAITLAASTLITTACDGHEETLSCRTKGHAEIEYTQHKVLAFSASDVITELTLLESDVTWGTTEEVPAELRGLTTLVTLEVEAISAATTTEYAVKHEDPDVHEAWCSNYVETTVNAKLSTPDGLLGESNTTTLTAYEIDHLVTLSGELSSANLSSSLVIPNADSINIVLFQSTGESSLQGSLSATFLNEAEEGLAPIARLVTLLTWGNSN